MIAVRPIYRLVTGSGHIHVGDPGTCGVTPMAVCPACGHTKQIIYLLIHARIPIVFQSYHARWTPNTMTAAPQAASDLRVSASHALRLGDSLKPASLARYTTVQYNYKPVITQPEDSTTSIVPTPDIETTTLSLKDGDEEYEYKGKASQEEHTYVLLPDKQGNGYVLERLSATYTYNLNSSPGEEDATRLAKRYPHISVSSSPAYRRTGNGQEAEDDALQDEPDPNNPFDFRNYLSGIESPPTGHPQQSNAGTPLVLQSTSRQATPVTRPARKAASAFVTQQRKPKSQPQTSDRPREKRENKMPSEGHARDDPSVPKVRLDRAASIKLPLRKNESGARAGVEEISLDDTDDLVLEGDAPQNSSIYQSKRSLGLALAGQLGGGPISLRSAASSPASRVNSPMPSRPSHLGEDIDLDEDDDVAMAGDERQERTRRSDDAEEDEEDADAEMDDDVDDLQLPSPAQTHRPSVSGTLVTADDDDDLEQQMLMAMEEDDDEGTSIHHIGGKAESDEESEEE